MSRIDKIKDTYKSNNNELFDGLLYGELDVINTKLVSKASIFIFTNFWIQLKGILNVFGKKKYMVIISNKGLKLQRIRRNGIKVAEKPIMIKYNDLISVNIKKVTIGNDYKLNFINNEGVKIVFELNIKNQKNDLNKLIPYLNRINNNLEKQN
ncbi:hypothetical protein [Haploplasma axanthum]|nr:hypothetical protein [Haploplasma axanthum]